MCHKTVLIKHWEEVNLLFFKRKKKRKPEWLLQVPVTLHLLSCLENRIYSSHKKIEAAFAVKKQYFLGLLPSKGYSAYQDKHTEGKKDKNLPMS